MTTEVAKLRSHVGRRAAGAIQAAVRRAPHSTKPVEVSLAESANVGGRDEVVVVVVVGQRAIVSRSRVRGRSIDLRELRLRLAGAEAAVEQIAASPPGPAAPSLSAAEARLLDEAGFVDSPSDVVTAVERSRIDLEIMLRESLSLAEAAAALGVGTSRLRQRLSSAERTLYGLKEGRDWRIPKFQFASKRRLVRGIGKVLPHIRPDAHPLAVKSWLTSPHQDLVLATDERPVSPIAWLAAGHSVEEVANLATEI